MSDERGEGVRSRQQPETRAEDERAVVEIGGVEPYHREAKLYCGIEHAQCRSARAQRNDVVLSLRAYLPLEVHRLRDPVRFYESKMLIMREAVRQYSVGPRP